MTTKQQQGQFYTVNCDYILEGLPIPPPFEGERLIEPFAGKGDLLTWLGTKGTYSVEAYDIDPKAPGIQQRDTLLHPPDYSGAWVVTNPPYLARNKSEGKTLFDLYETNDLYKCFLLSLCGPSAAPCRGGILILPAGFFLSPRDTDVRCREAFLSRYRLLSVRYFEESVFPDTTTTVVAFAFVAASEGGLTEQEVEWTSLPSGQQRRFTMRAVDDWIIGGDIYRLMGSVASAAPVRVRRYVEGLVLKEGEQLTHMTLCALDSGTMDGRIRLDYTEGYVYTGKESSRSFATLCLLGRSLTAEQQRSVCRRFNTFLEAKREATWSLFLPQYRESKEYARKRIPFELAYTIILWLLSTENMVHTVE